MIAEMPCGWQVPLELCAVLEAAAASGFLSGVPISLRLVPCDGGRLFLIIPIISKSQLEDSSGESNSGNALSGLVPDDSQCSILLKFKSDVQLGLQASVEPSVSSKPRPIGSNSWKGRGEGEGREGRERDGWRQEEEEERENTFCEVEDGPMSRGLQNAVSSQLALSAPVTPASQCSSF